MKQSLKITQYIIELLKASNDVMEIVPLNRIFPIDAKQGTKFPFIVIQRNSVTPQYSKDGCYQDTVSVRVTVVADRYEVSVEAITAVRDAIEKHYISGDGFTIRNIKMTAATETMYSNAYIQQCDFIVDVN